MDSSFAELTHAVPGHGSSSSLGAVTAGVGDETGVSRSVTTVATSADRGRYSAPHSAVGGVSGNGGNKDSPGLGSGLGSGTATAATVRQQH
ncbi:hypothetical protein NPX13_g8599 [Xylaria arbuscula]|uniref:Uncharacterized protein n=1 Tax=Xylaria arbuscula TaxID=114810 RepID=A0A9W8TJA3_9PEZI|nr:hypothetical protein NPX13_g8599 [Xylaria arbuscula]